MQPEKTVCRSRSDRTEHGTKDWFNIGKGMHQGYILSPAYLTYTQNTSCKMPGWMKHKLGSRLPKKNGNNLRYADDTSLMAESEEEPKSLLMKVEEESEKAG